MLSNHYVSPDVHSVLLKNPVKQCLGYTQVITDERKKFINIHHQKILTAQKKSQSSWRMSAAPRKTLQNKTFWILCDWCQSARPPQCLVTRTEKSLFIGLSCRLCVVFGTNKADLVTDGRFFIGNPSPLFCRSVGVAERSRYTSFFRWFRFPNDC